MTTAVCLQNYDLEEVVGEGATCTVHKGLDRRTGKRYALKVYTKDSKQECFDNEVRALSAVKHPNVLGLVESINPFEKSDRSKSESRKTTIGEDDFRERSDESILGSSNDFGEQSDASILVSSNDDLCSCGSSVDDPLPESTRDNKSKRRVLVLPLAPNGDVLSYLLEGGAFNPAVSRTVFRQLLLGLRACHNAGIIHRDLKPDNLLFDEYYSVRISDFGFSKKMSCDSNDNEERFYDDLGSRGYVAPEVGDSKGYNKECDLWSVGVTLFVMRTGRPPYGKSIG